MTLRATSLDILLRLRDEGGLDVPFNEEDVDEPGVGVSPRELESLAAPWSAMSVCSTGTCHVAR